METDRGPGRGWDGPSDHFVVNDGPAWCLLVGDTDTACGLPIAYPMKTQKACVDAAPAGVPVWRVYLKRTDGKTGKRLIRS